MEAWGPRSRPRGSNPGTGALQDRTDGTLRIAQEFESRRRWSVVLEKRTACGGVHRHMSDAGGTAFGPSLILDKEVARESGFADDDIAAEQRPHLFGPKAV